MVTVANNQSAEWEQKRRKQTLERAKANHLSRQLQMRLQYARLKVENGWQRQNLNEVENLYFHHSSAGRTSNPKANSHICNKQPKSYSNSNPLLKPTTRSSPFVSGTNSLLANVQPTSMDLAMAIATSMNEDQSPQMLVDDAASVFPKIITDVDMNKPLPTAKSKRLTSSEVRAVTPQATLSAQLDPILSLEGHETAIEAEVPEFTIQTIPNSSNSSQQSHPTLNNPPPSAEEPTIPHAIRLSSLPRPEQLMPIHNPIPRPTILLSNSISALTNPDAARTGSISPWSQPVGDTVAPTATSARENGSFVTEVNNGAKGGVSQVQGQAPFYRSHTVTRSATYKSLAPTSSNMASGSSQSTGSNATTGASSTVDNQFVSSSSLTYDSFWSGFRGSTTPTPLPMLTPSVAPTLTTPNAVGKPKTNQDGALNGISGMSPTNLFDLNLDIGMDFKDPGVGRGGSLQLRSSTINSSVGVNSGIYSHRL